MKDKARRRKLPVTAPPRILTRLDPEDGAVIRPTAGAGRGSSAHPRASASVIRRFHVLLKRKAQLQKDVGKGKAPESAVGNEAVRELEEVEREIETMGGLEAYQRMSVIGQGKERGGGAERVCVEWLMEIGVKEEMLKRKGKLKLLDVGALKPDNYASYTTWIDARPMDLRSRHPSIEEQDFLQMDLEAHAGTWDIISLSLVVNFVPEPRNRGRMLRYAHNMLRDGGYMFLALPLPCVTNSRYLTFEHLSQLLGHLGFEQVKERWKDGGKMAYWLFRKAEASGEGLEHRHSLGDVRRFERKMVLREGKRNNFCILL